MTTQTAAVLAVDQDTGRSDDRDQSLGPNGYLPPRVYKAGFVRALAARSGLPMSSIERVLDALVEELTQTVLRRQDVVLPGFGRFYLQMHRGHVTRFGGGRLDDYPVLKFSASKTMNKTLVPDAASDRDELGEPIQLSPSA